MNFVLARNAVTVCPNPLIDPIHSQRIAMTPYDEIDLYSGLAALHWSAYDDPAWDHDFY